MKYLSVCSGMEAASVAWHPLGWQPVGFSEIEPFPCAILKHRFPNIPNYGSLTEYHTWPIEPGTVDLLVGGTPCQSYSVAGKRGGLNDPRGQLMLSFLDLAQRLKARWVVWENVPGVLSSGQPRGSDFATFLQGLVERGYGWAFRVLDAQHFGVPQRRRRVFVVACLGDWRAPAEVLLESDCVRRDPKKGRAKGQGSAAGAEGGVECATGQRTHALTASQKGAIEDGTGRGTPIVIDRAAFNQGENAQYEPHIVQASELRLRGQITEQQTVPTLLANTKSGDNDPLAVHPVAFQPGNLRRQAGADPSTETFPTLKCDSGDQSPHVAYPVAGFKWHQGSQAGSIGYENGIAPTITTDKSPGVIHPVVPLDGMNLLSRLGPCGDEHSIQNFTPGDPSFTLKKGGNQHGVLTPMAVRRLTPVECERLQGFPDNWSRISWKGKPEEDCPDGPRYKACGNSMAVPCMRWIGQRIAEVDAKYPCNKAGA